MSAGKRFTALPSPLVNMAEWYQSVLAQAKLVDHGAVKGTMVIRPYAYSMWELLQAELNRRFRLFGVENASFPSLIPQSMLDREAEHVEGFAPEVAVVTHAGGKELEEPLVIRPTSETIIGHSMAKWVESYRDLPMKLNQWANVVRWELRPRLLLRTIEFLWHEVHTAHADEADARRETLSALEMYTSVAREMAAIPVVPGEKTPGERFPGAVCTFSIEAMMLDGKALQAGTVHYLGTNFAEALGIQYASKDGGREYAHTTSWGMSTRMLGAIIMAHGDEKGLVLPPRLAPIQVVVVPIGKGEQLDATTDYGRELVQKLVSKGVRAHLDDRDNLSTGSKYNYWELRGVPVRLCVGQRELDDGMVELSYRIGSEGKQSVRTDEVLEQMQALLDAYHDRLLLRAESFRDSRTTTVDSWDDFVTAVKTGWALAFHCGETACEDAIKAETSATPRCISSDQSSETGDCVLCGAPSAYNQRVIFARAY